MLGRTHTLRQPGLELFTVTDARSVYLNYHARLHSTHHPHHPPHTTRQLSRAALPGSLQHSPHSTHTPPQHI